MDINNPYDANEARRTLRVRLLDIARESGKDPEVVPHSYDTGPLFEHARSALRSRVVTADRELRHTLVAELGRAMLLSGTEEEGVALLTRAIGDAETPRDRAHFHFLLGHQHHLRRGEHREAQSELLAALENASDGRTVRAHTHLALAQVETNLGLFDLAVQSCDAALGSRVNEVHARAMLRKSAVAASQGDHDVARKLNRRAKKMFNTSRQESGVVQADLDMGTIDLHEGRPGDAIPIMNAVLEASTRYLDVATMASATNNLGIAYRQLGDPLTAREYLTESVRLHAELDRPATLYVALRNLARSHSDAEEPDMALAILNEVAAHAAREENPAQEFLSMSGALEVLADYRLRLKAAPYYLSRCYALLPASLPSLDKAAVAEFAALTARLGHAGAQLPKAERVQAPRGFPGQGVSDAARDLVGRTTRRWIAPTLRERLGEGLLMKWAPPVEDLSSFLLGWTGRWFRNGDYQNEFLTTQETSKVHLQALRREGVITQTGTRKGTRYQLGFHLT